MCEARAWWAVYDAESRESERACNTHTHILAIQAPLENHSAAHCDVMNASDAVRDGQFVLLLTRHNGERHRGSDLFTRFGSSLNAGSIAGWSRCTNKMGWKSHEMRNEVRQPGRQRLWSPRSDRMLVLPFSGFWILLIASVVIDCPERDAFVASLTLVCSSFPSPCPERR